MKKIFKLFIIACMSLSLFSACNIMRIKPLIQSDQIYNTSIEIMELMEMKASSEEYWQLSISGTPQSFAEQRAYFMANDYDTPIRGYKIMLSDSETAKQKFLFEENEQALFENLSDKLKEEISNKYANERVLFELIIIKMQYLGNGYHHGSVCTTTKTIEDCTIGAPAAYLYIFETGKPIIVLFRADSENKLVVTGYFLTNSEYKTLSETRDVFEPYGCTVDIEFHGSI